MNDETDRFQNDFDASTYMDYTRRDKPSVRNRRAYVIIIYYTADENNIMLRRVCGRRRLRKTDRFNDRFARRCDNR